MTFTLTTRRMQWQAIVTCALLACVRPSRAEWSKIDDFQPYPQAQLPLTAQDGGWQTADATASRFDVYGDELATGNRAVKIQHQQNTKATHDVLYHYGALDLSPGKTSTVFLRFLVEAGLNELGHVRDAKPVEPVTITFGLTERVMAAHNVRAGVVLEGLTLRAIGKARGDDKNKVSVERNRWYRLWMVVDNSPAGPTNKSKAFLQEEGSNGPLIPIPGALFSDKDNHATFWRSVGVTKNSKGGLTDLLVDDFYVDNGGENLTFPVNQSAAQDWRKKAEAEARQYAHLLKKADTWQQAHKQAAELTAAMTPEERFAYIRGDLRGVPGIVRLGLPTLVVNDAGSGINNGSPASKVRVPRSVAYPCTQLLAATWNNPIAQAYGRSLGEECRRYGTSILLGPGMNIYRSAQGGRNFEYFGEDPFLTGRQVASYVRGLQGAGTAATIKHFIGNEYEFHRRGANSLIDERTLHEIYMEPFRHGIEAGAWCVMSSYNQLNGEWAGESRYVNTELLRKDLGFQGIIMTDWVATYDGLKFIESGANLEMPFGTALTRDREKVFNNPGVERAVETILATAIYAGLLDRPALVEELETHRPQWEQVARQTNLEGITLLKNNGILPITPAHQGKKILVLGKMADKEELAGGGSGHVPGYNNKTYLQAIGETFAGAEVIYPANIKQLTDDQIRLADLVMVFASMPEGEGRDRVFVLPEEELVARCVELNSKTVVSLVTGGAVQMDWADKAAAVVQTYFGGQTGAAALMEILTGKAEPAGRLPFTVEKKAQDSVGVTLAELQKPNTSRSYDAGILPFGGGEFFKSPDKKLGYVWDHPYTEGILVGYRWYQAKNLPVRYPFGYGLSYTSFGYSDIKTQVLDKEHVKVSFTIRNTGPRAGSDVAQIYVHQAKSSLPRPPQELKAFEKVRLEPGETRQVELQLTSEAFRFWDPARKGWVVEPGEFEIRVGASSADIRLKQSVNLPA